MLDADPDRAEEFLAFAERLADAARTAILPFFRAAYSTHNKAERGSFDPVTEADKAAERAMRALIEETYPDHGILGEEYGDKPSRCAYVWALDPIDGTRGFLAGVPLWGTLIALAENGRPLIGVLDQAYSGERFRGWPGGADRDGREGKRTLRVRPCVALNQATLSTTDPYLFKGAESAAFEQVRQGAQLTRFGYDCYAYGMLAAGFIDLVVESGLRPFDIQALIPIIEGAGGLVTDWRGGPAWAGGQVIAAGDPRTHEQALAVLSRAVA